ncbi:uncharacterized protein LOC129601723 [Paramacrobiotus metropolitanus]|uniref:uncharacterized protein LOC129601723 n=1 Tax=Paramacrobiotus metropolitanus TaxID=2943436 RepID=UPI002445AB9B|nr:uncharacterized protein LOC129601723 [Paramacrobiotus metropolitanus]
MDCAPLVMPQFEPLLADANHMSYQNTVAVHNDDDSWCLGFIQDMDGDRAFIHFDSKKVTARWVHLGRVWALPFYANTCSLQDPPDMPIYAALRDEDDGPFRFRPVIDLGRLRGCDKCELFCIQTNIAGSNSQQNPAGWDIVQNCQITKQLPPAGAPLLDRSSSGLRYTKYMVPFPPAEAIFSDASDKFRIIKHFRNAFERNRAFLPMWDCCRFHLRAERDGCTFVVMSPVLDAEMDQHMGVALTRVLETHLDSRVHLPAIRLRNTHVIENCLPETDAESPSFCTVARLSHLPPSILSEIFPYMDLHSQMRAKRVCGLWQLLLDSPRLAEHISVSLESCAGIQSDNNNCFRMASLLARSIRSTTASITVLDAFRPHNQLFLAATLEAINITLPLIVFKDHIITDPGKMGSIEAADLQHPAADIMTLYRHHCKLILLHNWKIDHLFGQTMCFVFKQKIMYQFGTGHPLPAHEQAFMRPITKQSHELPIDHLRITIPRKLLRCDDDDMDMTSRIMCALNDNFPPVTEEMLERVTAVYARWLRTLNYPDDWQPIRNYLLLFSPFEPDGQPKSWEGVDLRAVDVTTLSRMAIYGIDALFQV